MKKNIQECNKPKRPKVYSITQLKKKLDGIFSQFIRLNESDYRGMCRCVSCGKEYFWKDIQNGHYFSRISNATRFEERNCHPQCYACNVGLHGNIHEYRKAMVRMYGEDGLDELDRLHNTIVKFGRSDYERMISHYKQKVEELLANKIL